MNINYESLTKPVSPSEVKAYKEQYLATINFNKHSINLNVLMIVLALIVLVLAYFRIFGGVLFILSGTAVAFMAIKNAQKIFLGYTKIDRFAKNNGLVFKVNTEAPGYEGMIFNVGSRRSATSQLRDADNKLFEIGNYSYETGTGDDERTISRGYIMIRLGHKLPNIVLDSAKNNSKGILGIKSSNLPLAFDKSQKLSLEGDFDKWFTLYAPKDYERDALYIFSPDLMALFIDESSGFDAEIIDDKLFIYSEFTFDMSDPVLLQKLFRIIEQVGAKVFSQTDKYLDEKIGIGLAGAIDKSGQHLKSKKPIFIYVFLSIVAMFVVYWFIVGLLVK